MAEEEAAEILAEVKYGKVFVHKRYITEDRRPEYCYISHTTWREGKIDMVYYRVGSPKGYLTKATAEYFVNESFKEWA